MKSIMTMKHYQLGLSLIGILAVFLVMLPNLMYLFYTPPNDILSGNKAHNCIWNILEIICRFGLIITLCVVVNKTAPSQNRVVTISAIFSLLAYYALWIFYFAGAFNGLSLIGLVFFPSVFFLLTAWRQRNLFALVFSLLFATVHIAITSSNFLL